MEDHGFIALGKYSCARDSILHYLCISDWANDSFGNVEAPTGYVWRISNDYEDVKLENGEFNSVLDEWFESNGEVQDDVWLRRELVGHFLVVENDQGFVNVIKYDRREELDGQFLELSNAFDVWNVDEDEL